jgi:hypothetical protein
VVLRRVDAISIGVWREEEGRRKGRTQGEFVIKFCCFCAAINLIMCLSLRIGRGAVQKFCEWVTAVVLVISRNFLGLISGNQWDNHLELYHTFPTSTYALDSEL